MESVMPVELKDATNVKPETLRIASNASTNQPNWKTESVFVPNQTKLSTSMVTAPTVWSEDARNVLGVPWNAAPARMPKPNWSMVNANVPQTNP